MAGYALPIYLTLNYVEWLFSNGRGLCALLDDEVFDMSEAYLHQCNLCGDTYTAIPIVLKRWLKTGDNGCRLCFPKEGGRNPWSQSRYEEALMASHYGTVVLLGKYLNQNTPVLHRCLTCTTEWMPHPGLLLARHGCPTCGMRKAAASSVRRKMVSFDGKTFTGLQGYEPAAIEWIIANKGLSAKDLVSAAEGTPVIRYSCAGNEHKHFPDFFVPSRNLLIEVKSEYTFRKALDKNAAKCRAAKAQGYRYVMLVLGRDGSRLRLPNGWQTMDHTTLTEKTTWLKN